MGLEGPAARVRASHFAAVGVLVTTLHVLVVVGPIGEMTGAIETRVRPLARMLTSVHLDTARRVSNSDLMLPNFMTPLLLNAVNFVIFRDNLMISPIFGLFSSRAIQNIPNLLGYLEWFPS